MLRNSSNYMGDLVQDFWNDLVDTAKYYSSEYKGVEFGDKQVKLFGNKAVLKFEAYFPTPKELEELVEFEEWDSLSNWLSHEGLKLEYALQDMLEGLDWDISLYDIGTVELDKRQGLYCPVQITLNLPQTNKYAKDLPKDVERYVDEGLEQGMPEDKAWAIAWSRYCQYKNPGSEHCKQDDYFPGREKKSSTELAVALSKLTDQQIQMVWDGLQAAGNIDAPVLSAFTKEFTKRKMEPNSKKAASSDEINKVLDVMSKGWQTGNKGLLTQAIQIGLSLGMSDKEMEQLVLSTLEDYLDKKLSSVVSLLKSPSREITIMEDTASFGVYGKELEIVVEALTPPYTQLGSDYTKVGELIMKNTIRGLGLDFLKFNISTHWDITDSHDSHMSGAEWGQLNCYGTCSVYAQLR